jgi:succinate-acetate transporter protein
MNNKSVVLTTIGFMCIGMTVWMMNLVSAGWVSGSTMYGMAMDFALGSVVLGVIAILTFFHGRTLDAIIFFAAAGYFWTMQHAGNGDSASTVGWFWLVWAVFVFYVWLGSFKAGWARMLFLLAAWTSLLMGCLLSWTGMGFLNTVSGYLGLAAGLVALYISFAEVLNYGNGKVILPTGSTDS